MKFEKDERREFSTGAVRDSVTGKGDMISLPWEALLRLSKHYERGAEHYGRWNYTKGIPISSFMDKPDAPGEDTLEATLMGTSKLLNSIVDQLRCFADRMGVQR